MKIQRQTNSTPRDRVDENASNYNCLHQFGAVFRTPADDDDDGARKTVENNSLQNRKNSV